MRRGRVAQLPTAHKGDIVHRLPGSFQVKLAFSLSLFESWCRWPILEIIVSSLVREEGIPTLGGYVLGRNKANMPKGQRGSVSAVLSPKNGSSSHEGSRLNEGKHSQYPVEGTVQHDWCSFERPKGSDSDSTRPPSRGRPLLLASSNRSSSWNCTSRGLTATDGLHVSGRNGRPTSLRPNVF
jgi:hypothetical protein